MAQFTGFDEAIVVDVETTGLDPSTDRIVSVGLLRVKFGNLRENRNSLDGRTMDAVINPQCPIPWEASRIHGITNKDVANRSPFSDIAQELRDFIGDRPIIAHNASFDKSFLNAEFKRAGVKTLARNRSYCTMRRFQDFNNGRRKGSNLNDVVAVMGVERRKGDVHDASEDAKLAWKIAEVFYRMDNGIDVPGGDPVSPWRNEDCDEDSGSRRRNSESQSCLGTIVGAIFVAVLLAWWIL